MTMKNRIALSIDIEDWYHTPLFIGTEDSRYKTLERFYESYTERYDYITKPTKRILEMLESHNIRATFFVVADICFHYPELIELLAKSPHEIACHGRYHYPKYDPATGEALVAGDQFESWTREAREILETHTGKEIIGYRAPIGYINREMLSIISALGFQYDSSISANSMYSKSEMISEDTDTRPFQILAAHGKTITELPWSYLDVMGYRVPTAGAFFLRTLGPTITSMGLKQALKRGDTMLYFHSMDICREKFPVKSTNGRPYYWFRKGVKTENMLVKIFKKFEGRFTTCEDVYKRNC